MQLNLMFDFNHTNQNNQKYEDFLLGKRFLSKLSTNKLNIKQDRKDPRYPSTIYNVKMPIKLENGTLILSGNLTCNYFKANF